MKLTYLLSLLCLLSFAACKGAPKETEEEKTETLVDEEAGKDLLYAYADTLTQIADSLEAVYNSAISEYARMPDSLSWIEAKHTMAAQTLEQKLVELNNSIHGLLLDKKVSEEEYQKASIDIDMNGVSDALEKLKMIGINLSRTDTSAGTSATE